MNLKTEQILGTLQVLLDEPKLYFRLRDNERTSLKPFVWNGEQHGKFSVLELMKTQNWATLTDVELAFKQWQNTARLGHLNRDDYPEDYDGLLAEEAVHQQNESVFQQVQAYFKRKLLLFSLGH